MGKKRGRDDGEDDYKFLRIADAMAALSQRVNIIGAVVSTSVHKKTKGTDCFCSLKIVDESCPSPGISVNFFAESMEKLPHVECGGDIIQLSHVVMKTHDGEAYAQYDKRFSSFALYDGNLSTNFIPYQFSSKFHAREQDKKFIEGLRKRSNDCQSGTASKVSLPLKEIREGQEVNLVCKVLHICEVTKEEWMLFVWDGTDTQPVTLRSKLEEHLGNYLPLQLESFPLSRDILCSFPVVGTVLRVTADPSNLGLHLIKAGRWVKFIHINCEIRSGFWCGVLKPFSKIRYLPDDDNHVLQCQRSYHERVKPKWGWMPLFCFPWPSHVTVIDYKAAPFVTLMNILSYPEVTAKFQCVVRVLAAYPCHAEDFRTAAGFYRIRLTLEDPTARLHAYLYGEDGVNFFGGHPTTDIMTKKLNILLGVDESDASVEDKPRSPPWVHCCLKSYYTNKNDPWGSRRYRIFGTSIREESLR